MTDITITESVMDDIEDILDNFDFERVHKVMVALDWRWVDLYVDKTEIPDMHRLRKTARGLLKQAYKISVRDSHLEDTMVVASGGFVARCNNQQNPPWFRLAFEVESNSTTGE